MLNSRLWKSCESAVNKLLAGCEIFYSTLILKIKEHSRLWKLGQIFYGLLAVYPHSNFGFRPLLFIDFSPHYTLPTSTIKFKKGIK